MGPLRFISVSLAMVAFAQINPVSVGHEFRQDDRPSPLLPTAPSGSRMGTSRTHGRRVTRWASSRAPITAPHISPTRWFTRTIPAARAVLDAIRKRHTHGAMDNIVLDVRMGSHFLGDEFALSKSQPIHVKGARDADHRERHSQRRQSDLFDGTEAAEYRFSVRG